MDLPSVKDFDSKPFDVVVVGGGMAGIAAAIAAARHGAQTLLIEKAGFLGGLGVTGATGLHSLHNIFGAHPGAERLRVVAGIAQELVDRVEQLGGGMGHVRIEKGPEFLSMETPVEPETFKVVAAKTCIEAGVKLLFHTIMDQVRTTNGQIDGVFIWNKGGRTLVRAKQYIDCTGDGDLAAYAGAPFKHFKATDKGAYRAGFTFRLCNIDLTKMEKDLARQKRIVYLAHAVKPGMHQPDLVRIGFSLSGLSRKTDNIFFLGTSIRPREITICNCLNYGPNDGLDVEALTAAETTLREQMFDIAETFRQNLDGCEGCYPAGAAPAVGQRRARAIHCEYELTREDCISGRQFEDQIGCFSFIDIFPTFVKDAGAFGIPYRALIPQGVDNLLIAGRMMSPDDTAFAGTRNTPCCLICGQAAGTAAAIAVSKGILPRNVNPETLREMLSKDGVLLEPIPDPITENE